MFPESLEVWVNHFEYHALNPTAVPPGLSDVLSATERQRIALSMATFQLGERSEGRGLLRAAEEFAAAHRLPALRRLVELVVLEERRHAALLQGFMEDHGIALLRSHWTDNIFRRLRRLSGLELYLHVLLCAELIGIVYYRALQAATRCQRLQVLCSALVADELAHVGLESEILMAMQARRVPVLQAFVRRTHRLLFAAAAQVVWQTHSTVLREAGYDRRGFLRACRGQYAFYLEPTHVVLTTRLVRIPLGQ